MEEVLEGVRVVDFSRGFPGTLAAMILSDHSAEVIRIEPPAGDPERALPAFPMWRRGQKSVVLDLHDAGDRAKGAALAASADVLLQNWRPGVAERLGLGYEELAERNAGLIYCAITGFGSKGPYAGVKAYEGVVGARAGRYASREPRWGTTGREGPRYLGSPHASYAAAHAALQGILAALYVRLRHGRGQRVDTSLVQALSVFDVWDSPIEAVAAKYPDAYAITPAVSKSGVPLSPYFFRLLVAPSSDGRWFQFANVMDHHWRAFINALELTHTFDDPDFADSPNFATEEASVRFWTLLLDRLKEKTADEWMAIFVQDDDIAFDLFRTTDDARNHPQMRINGHVIDVEDPELGPMEQIGPQLTLFGTPAQIRAGAPRPGEHQALLDHLDRQPAAPASLAKTPLPAHPLEGVTVLEIGTWFAAPFGVTLLAELGARVIKIEPLGGDPLRFGLQLPETGAINTIPGKESVAVDLRTEEGQKIVQAIARDVDLVMCSFREGAAERQQVDYETLKKLNPNIVYHRGVAYGIEGPFVLHPVYGPTPPAIAGETLYQAGDGFLPPPEQPITLDQIREISMRIRQLNPGLGDPIAATAVATAMLMGLIARERLGSGQLSMTTMIGSCAYLMSEDFVWYEGKPARKLPDPELYGMGPLYRLYQASDGWIFLALTDDDEWNDLCRALKDATDGRADLAGDDRFADQEKRRLHADALGEALSKIIAARPYAEWEQLLQAADVACVWVNDKPHSYFSTRDPIMAANGFIGQIDHFMYGDLPRHGLTVNLSETPGLLRPAPAIGEHTRPVLQEFGYSEEQIAALAEREIVLL